MALAPPQNPAERRQRVTALLAAYNAAPSTFNLFNWFYGPSGPGAAETDRGADNLATYYGVQRRHLSTRWWRTRLDGELGALADAAEAAGLYTGDTSTADWSARKHQVLMTWLNQVAG